MTARDRGEPHQLERRPTIGLSMVLGLAAVVAGLVVAYYANLAPGGSIVLVAAGMFVASSTVPLFRRLFRP